jgi:hypothetical protein
MALITLERAKRNLNETGSDHDGDIYAKLEEAQALVIGRCNSTAHWREITATWTEDTIPLEIQSAILIMLTHLYQHRGDDMRLDAEAWAAVERQIGQYKDPVIA